MKQITLALAVLSTLIVTTDIFFLHGLTRAALSLVGIHI